METDTRQQKMHMPASGGKTHRPMKNALQIAGIYFIVGSLWIFFSDSLARLITTDMAGYNAISTVKGILYVIVTAAMLFYLVRRALKAEAAYAAKLDSSLASLQENYTLLDASRISLAESEEQYRQLFNAMLCGWCVHELVYAAPGEPVGMRTLNSNSAYDEIAGKSPEGEDGFMHLLSGERRFWLDGFHAVVVAGSTMHFQLYSESVGRYLEFTVFRPAPGRFATIINDISDRKQIEKALDAETEQLRVTLDSIGDGVIAADNEGLVTMVNGVAEKFTGWPQHEAIGRPIGEVLELYGGPSGLAFAAMTSSVFSRKEATNFHSDMRIRSRDGVERIISGRAAPMKGGDGGMLGLVFVFRDVTEQQKREAEILYLSYHDTLTGLYNRTFFEEELRRLDTERQLPLSVIMGDANNLKLVNDVFGHREGDELIKAMAQVLRDSCRSEDIISRWGGDEFTILLPHTDYESAAMIARRILTRCREHYTADKQMSPSLSLGYDTKASSDTDMSHVIKAAEDMMYKNKLLDSRTAHNDFLMAMRSRIGQGDLESAEHTSKICELCERVGRELNLKDNDLADLRILSLLHDIGKAAIDTRILNKPGSLTDDEWEEIKRHSSIGYRIVRSAPELVLVADYILGHHERWDGQGYPQGLKGESIPLASRIFAVVDAFDVMTQGRPYKPAMPYEEAVREIFLNSGTQFDPEVVTAFVSVLNNLTDTIL